jgi:hypothetical protein
MKNRLRSPTGQKNIPLPTVGTAGLPDYAIHWIDFQHAILPDMEVSMWQ